MRLKLIFTFLVLCGSVSLTFAQGSATFPPSGGSAAKVCVGTPGNTLGTYLSQCQSTAIPPILYICGNVAGCSVSADWTPTNGTGTFSYPTSTGFVIVTSGSSWGTTLADPLTGTHGGSGVNNGSFTETRSGMMDGMMDGTGWCGGWDGMVWWMGQDGVVWWMG